MATIAFIIPLAVVVLVSLVAHSLTPRYWTANTFVGVVSGIGYLLMLLSFNGFAYIVQSVGVSLVAALISYMASILFGIPFVTGRALQRRH